MRWVLMGAVVVVFAAVVLVGPRLLRAFDESSCPSGANTPTPVLVARRLIPAGTPGSAIVSRRLFAAGAIPCGERKEGALADPSELDGTVTVVDLFPGQQITESDIASR